MIRKKEINIINVCPFMSFISPISDLVRIECLKNECVIYDDERKECSQKPNKENIDSLIEQLRVMNMSLGQIRDNIWDK